MGAHNWQKVDLREIRVRGEIGRRVDLAVYGNLLKMEIDKPFLDHFRRIMSELPEYLFYKSGDVLFANLYSECDLETELGGAKVRVEERTAYPSDGRIGFTFRPDRPRTTL